MKSEAFNYSDGADHFIGHLAWDETLDGPQPSVLIAPAFGGLSDFERARAEELAALGYVAIAVDYYGNGKRARSPEEAQALMGTLQADRKILARRMVAACDAASSDIFILCLYMFYYEFCVLLYLRIRRVLIL